MEISPPVQRCARWAGQALRLRGPLANDPTSEILQTLLVGLVCWIVVNIVLIVPLYAVHKPGSLALSILAGLTFATALTFLHRGLFRSAGILYLLGLWLPVTITIVWNGGIHGVTMVFYIALPISAAWLLGYRASLITAGVCLSCALAIALVEANGVRLPNYTPGHPISTWMNLLLAMIVAAVPTAQALQILKKALIQSESAREALAESEERFRNMADTAPIMMWTSGPDKLCTFFNKVWLDFTGRSMEQELGNGWSEGVHPDDLVRCVSTYAASFDARDSFRMEYRLRRADGEYRWVLDDGVPRFATGGVFVGYIGSCIDISNLKRAHEEHLAKQKLETVGSLASGIAHDFNNILSGVLANSEVALAELAGASPTQELERIRDVTLRGADIVRQLMIYTGQESAVLELVDVSLVVEDMIGLLKVSVSKRVTLESDLDKHLPMVRGNPSQIRQLVMNLITNASEAIGNRDGVIRVSTRRVTVSRGGPVTLEGWPEGDYVQLEVTDNGRGMTPEVQAKVLDSFFTTKTEGIHGLGLAVVQRIVVDFRGTIRLSSAPGKGTTFQIMLPCEGQIVEATRRAIA